MLRSRLLLAIGILSVSSSVVLAGLSAPQSALAATPHAVPAHVAPMKATAHALPVKASAATHNSGNAPTAELLNFANDECLNGALVTSHAEVTLTPCNEADNHMSWTETEGTVNGDLAYILKDDANNECLNGTLAKVYLTPCRTDPHMEWIVLVTSTGQNNDLFESAQDSNYCLNGALVTSHAEVTLTPCNDDLHMLWNDYGFPH